MYGARKVKPVERTNRTSGTPQPLLFGVLIRSLAGRSFYGWSHIDGRKRKRDKRDELLAAGADHVIVTEEEDLVARVKAITNGAGARLIFDPIAGPLLEKLAEAVAQGVMLGNSGSKMTAFDTVVDIILGTGECLRIVDSLCKPVAADIQGFRECRDNRPGCTNLRRHHRPGHRCLTGCPNQTRGARPNNLTVPCEPTHKTTWRFPLWI